MSQSRSRKLRFAMPRTRPHGLGLMEGSFAGPQGNLPFQPWKMRNRLGTLTQGRDWMAITCCCGICFSPVENKSVRLRKQSLSFGGFPFKNKKTNKGSKEDLHLLGVQGRLQSWGEQHRDPCKGFWAVIWSSSGSTCADLWAQGCRRYLCVQVPGLGREATPPGRELLISSAGCFQDMNSSSLSSTWVRPSSQQAVKTPVCRWNYSFLMCLHDLHQFFTWNASLRWVAFPNVSNEEKWVFTIIQR